MHTEAIAKDTVFTDIAGLDIVQGLGTYRSRKPLLMYTVLLASWGTLGWRTGSRFMETITY
jgi:hypothetical protein